MFSVEVRQESTSRSVPAVVAPTRPSRLRSAAGRSVEKSGITGPFCRRVTTIMGRITAVAACAAAVFVLSSPPQGRVQLVDDQQQDPNAAPRINAPAGQPQHEQDQYDLLDQFQDGQGPTFGGDPRKCTPDGLMVNIPRSPASERAPGPPGTRVLPTGTALGPNGHRYAFFQPPKQRGPAAGDSPWVSNGSVWDFTGPAHPFKVGDLPGIYQASGVYDSATTQMFIIGNGSGQARRPQPRFMGIAAH